MLKDILNYNLKKRKVHVDADFTGGGGIWSFAENIALPLSKKE